MIIIIIREVGISFAYYFILGVCCWGAVSHSKIVDGRHH